ncbi:dual specificity protein phosphatase 19-like [Teleopsis dalmanni]|uniref:dual specificity protein phosphatase 19-like n=1 Tax=Teleopsis dalmanni TaxID=139649 RepID=UPI0018CFA055|nr:dual specificity protein phosphatase 19-like [Teleopsis dalmanni]
MPIIENMNDNLHTKFLPCLDLPETDLFAGLMQDAFTYIKEAKLTNGIVLVHCNAGVSRSASVVIAYLIKHCQMKFDDAYAYVKGKRACVQPNSGFLEQLKKFCE